MRLSGRPRAGNDQCQKSEPGLLKEKCAMKMFSGFYFAGTLAFFLLLLAAPAFGQFEVSPDHFDGPPPPPNTKKMPSVKTPSNQTKSQHRAATAKAGTTKKHTAAKSAQLRKLQPGTRAAANTTSTTKKGASTNQRHGTSSTSAQAGPSLKAQVLPAHRE
jgi:hypothetical protein